MDININSLRAQKISPRIEKKFLDTIVKWKGMSNNPAKYTLFVWNSFTLHFFFAVNAKNTVVQLCYYIISDSTSFITAIIHELIYLYVLYMVVTAASVSF